LSFCRYASLKILENLPGYLRIFALPSDKNPAAYCTIYLVTAP